MKTGVVVSYNIIKNYGFIATDDGSGDTFVHIKKVQKAGLEKLIVGQKISYVIKLDKVKNKNYASKLSLINDIIWEYFIESKLFHMQISNNIQLNIEEENDKIEYPLCQQSQRKATIQQRITAYLNS